MMKHKQLIQHHDPENGQWGDCFRTSIACILDMNPQDVPHFMGKDFDNEKVIRDINNWLQAVGRDDLFYIELCGPSEIVYNVGFHVMSGRSPRATKDKPLYHACVGYNGEVFHDPHNSNIGLEPYTDDDNMQSEYLYGVFINRNAGLYGGRLL